MHPTTPLPPRGTQRILRIASATLLLSACSDGLLTNAEAAPPCAPDDLRCQSGALAPLAVGAKLDLKVTPTLTPGGEVPATHLRVVDDTVATEVEGRLQAVGPGVTAVLFLTSEGRVLDFTHLATAEADQLHLVRGQGADLDPRALDGTLTLSPGEEIALTVLARSDSQVLGGDLSAALTSEDGRVVIKADAGDGFTVRAPAADALTAPLQTTLRATALGLSKSISLEVIP